MAFKQLGIKDTGQDFILFFSVLFCYDNTSFKVAIRVKKLRAPPTPPLPSQTTQKRRVGEPKTKILDFRPYLKGGITGSANPCHNGAEWVVID